MPDCIARRSKVMCSDFWYNNHVVILIQIESRRMLWLSHPRYLTATVHNRLTNTN